MKRLFAGFGLLLATASAVLGQIAEGYTNRGSVTEAPQINARRFVNKGSFNLFLSSDKPFETQNTETYLNEGTISVSPGFRFGLLDNAGFRKPALLFSNSVRGTITAQEGFSFLTLNRYRSSPDSFLLVNADTIINRGSLIGSIGGEVRLEGNTVDLARSAIDIASFPDGQASGITRRRLPGQYDIYWQYEQTNFLYADFYALSRLTNVALGVTNVFTALTGRTPTVGVQTDATNNFNGVAGFRDNDSFNFAGIVGQDIVPFVWIRTNAPGGTLGATNPATNQIITVLLVRRSDTNILVDAAAAFGPDPNFPLPTVDVRLVSLSTNLVSGNTDATTLRVRNTYGRFPDPQFVSNSITHVTYMPTNLSFARATVFGVTNPLNPTIAFNTNLFPGALSNLYVQLRAGAQTVPVGITNNAVLATNLMTAWLGGGLTNALTYTNAGGTNPFMAYKAQFVATGTTVPQNLADVPDAALTNIAGRIVINAKNLDLTKTRMRSQGPVIIRADNIVGNAGAAVDAPYVDADIGAAGGKLNLSGLFRSSVERFAGELRVFSTIWTNTVDYTFTTTNAVDPGTGGTPTTTDTTINLQGVFHIMYLDADLTSTSLTPFVDLKLRSQEVVLGDQFRVTRLTALDTEDLTVNGELSLIGTNLNGTVRWNAASFPSLKRLTNNGSIAVNNEIVMGTDRAVGYERIESIGSIDGSYLDFKATSIRLLEGSTTTASSGDVDLNGDDVELGGFVVAGGQGALNVTAKNLQLGGAGLAASVASYISLNVSDKLVTGPSPATLFTSYGFDLPAMPGEVDLRNLFVTMQVPNFADGVITWPGLDRGGSLSALGTDSIGSLFLGSGLGSTISFAPTGESGALYVGGLIIAPELVGTNSTTGELILLGEFNIPSNFTVYFASASVPGAELERLTGGRFRQLTDAGVGGFTLVETLINGRPTQVDRSLRFSAVLDSDSDGVVNALDDSPFDGVVVKNAAVLEDGLPGFRITWEAAPGQSYEVQYCTGDAVGDWQLLEKVTNTSSEYKTLWVRDPIGAGDGSKLYQIIYR
jgi:hypothetical protein